VIQRNYKAVSAPYHRQLHYHGGVLSSLDFVELVHLFFEFVKLSVKNLRKSEGGERARQ
jgi:hypothetical protein